MRCNCFKNVAERIKEKNPEWKDIAINRLFDLHGNVFPFVEVFYKELQKNKKKYKEKSIKIKVNFCPFCGMKTGD